MSTDDLRYNEVRQKSSHNCFQRREGIHDQVFYWRIRSLEVDIHRGKPLRDRLDGDWYVYHTAFLDPDTTVDLLSGFWDLCRGIGRAMPEHEVITVFVDIKDAFHKTDAASQSGRAFDTLVTSRLGRDALFTPADLLARAPGAGSLREAVQESGWPTLAELRGKFLVVLTGPHGDQATYAGAGDAAKKAAFLSRRISKADGLDGPGHVVFFNMDAKNVSAASRVREAGFVSRAYYVDDSRRWKQARDHGCNHIATDKVSVTADGWARTHAVDGFPFQALEGATPRGRERCTLCGVWTRSGDLWAQEDDFYFHYKKRPDGDLDHIYRFFISGPNSHVEDWIKAGVMARASLARGAPYFGVFRIGEHHGLRVQYRGAHGGHTVAMERVVGPEGLFDPDTLVFVKLSISADGHHGRAWGSADGDDWVEIGKAEFLEPLRYHGVGVSGFGEPLGAKFLFGVPGAGAPPDFDRRRFIGRDPQDPTGWADWDGDRQWRMADFHLP